MREWVFWVVLFMAVLIEGGFTSLPLVLDALLIFYLIKKKQWLFPVAFLGGILLDIILLRTPGQSSLFFVVFLFILSLYEKKFEIQTIPFIFFSSFFASLAFLAIFGYSFIFPQALVSSLVAVFLFKVLNGVKSYENR